MSATASSRERRAAPRAGQDEREIVDQLTYPISPEYVRSWSVERALAELVANALDEDPEFVFDYSDGVLRIEDAGDGVPAEGLVLGLSDKSDSQIGQFGEGLQIASLVLARSDEVRNIEVESVGYGFRPSITHSSPVGLATRDSGRKTALLRYDFFSSSRTRGTKITLECSEQIAAAVKERFLHFEDGYTPPPAPGRMLSDRRGRIYIGGVLVQTNKDLRFSYDLALESAKGLQNRDRTEISGWQLDALCRNVRSSCRDLSLISEWLCAALKGELKANEAVLQPENWHRREVPKLREKIFGQRAVSYSASADSDEQGLELRDQGYELLKPPSGMGHHIFEQLMRLLDVPSAGQLVRDPSKQRRRKTEWIAEDKLTDSERDVLHTAVKLIRGIWGNRAIDRFGVYESTELEGVGSNTALGFYQPRGGKIGVQRAQLRGLQPALNVLVHEAAHRMRHRFGPFSAPNSAAVSGDYGDRTRGFEEQLGTMAAQAALLMHESGAAPEPAAIEDEPEPLSTRCGSWIKSKALEAGYPSALALSKATGMTIGRVRSLLRGSRLCVEDIQDICEFLELPSWGPIWLVCACERFLVNDLRRRKNGRLASPNYGHFRAAQEATKELGGSWADAVEGLESDVEALPDEPDYSRYERLLNLLTEGGTAA